MKSKNLSLQEAWNTTKGLPFLSKSKVFILLIKVLLVIPFKLYKTISANIRFGKRDSRNRSIKDAPIRIVWQHFIVNCMKNYVPSEQLTVDEQLCITRGRFGFKCYIPTKPSRYGIKIWVLADAKNAYMLNTQIYTGKVNKSPEKIQGNRVVRELSDPFSDKGQTITTDNFFTSLNIAKHLRHRKTALVGTVKKNRRFLTPYFQKKRKSIGTDYLFSDNMTLIRYSDKKGKSVLLLSSLHSNEELAGNLKPEIVNYYNSTKAGVDILDQLIRFYSARRKSNRWPVTLFYNMIDICGYNAF